MTTEEIEQLLATRETDVLVHERFFGSATEYSNLFGVGEWVDAGTNYYRPIPKYTTDLVAAWKVMEALRARFSNVALHGDNGWGLTVWHVGREGMEGRFHGPCNAATAPHAIALTALLTTVKDEEAGQTSNKGKIGLPGASGND